VTVIALIAGLLLGAGAVYLWARAELARRDARVRTDEQWEEHLKAVTAATLSASSTSLLDLADAKLQPIKETLERFEQQSRALEQKRAAEIGAIPQLVESLRRETGSLVTALRSPHVRGGWGEVQLKRVVELAGMVAHCDFVEQATSRGPTSSSSCRAGRASSSTRRPRSRPTSTRARPRTTTPAARISRGTRSSCATT
jgi:DNA recombination protein RmuC